MGMRKRLPNHFLKVVRGFFILCSRKTIAEMARTSFKPLFK